MKATINGIQVEGTPEELVKYQEIIKVNESRKPFPNPNFQPYKVTYPNTIPAGPLYPIYFGDSPIDTNKVTCIYLDMMDDALQKVDPK